MFKGLKLPIFIFLMALAVTSVIFGGFHFEFGSIEYFQKRGILFLVFISFFPRLTLLFSSVAFGGFFWWLGFFFMPRLLVAVLATIAYGKTNPLLVAVAWTVAIYGEFMEKKKLSGSRGFVFRTYRAGRPQESHTQGSMIDRNGVVEAEFTRKD